MGQERVSGRVKFFDRNKGYGFVALEGGGDAFLHASVFESARLDFPSEGDTILGRVESGPRGPQMVDVQRPPRRASRAEPRSAEREGKPALGSVKWFDPAKGYGFVAVDEGGPDAILHRSTLDRHRLPALGEGQRVLILVADRPKGREVIALATLEAEVAARPPGRVLEARHPFRGERGGEGWGPRRRPGQRAPAPIDPPDDVGE